MTSFTKGQLVWAKIKGKAWWPALVSETSLQKNKGTGFETEVHFVGETLSATVDQDNIADFDTKFKEFSKNKGKKFQEVLKEALELAKNNSKPQENQEKGRNELSNSQSTEANIESVAAPPKKARGRPKKNIEKEPPVNVETKPSVPIVPKEVKKSAHQSKSQEQKQPEKTMVVEETKENETSHEQKVAPTITERSTRSKKGSQTLAEPLVPTAKKGRKAAQAQKEDIKVIESSEPVKVSITVKKGRKATVPKEEKMSVVQTQIENNNEPEAMMEIGKEKEKDRMEEVEPIELEEKDKPMVMRSNCSLIPLPENFKARNLLVSITAEPSTRSHIEVTTSKKQPKSILKNRNEPPQMKTPRLPLMKGTSINRMNSSTISQVGNSSKRAACMWYRDVPPSVYLTHEKARSHRNIATDYIVKKIKASPNFQERMSSVKATKIKDLQTDKNWVSKARVAYNSLMIRKLENDLEHLIYKLVRRFKSEGILCQNDEEYIKIQNITAEFERSKFTGPEFISSEVGKLMKTLHRLLLNNKELINDEDGELILMVAKILHRVKDNIIKFCLDNTGYVETFGMEEMRDKMSFSGAMEVIELDKNEIKLEDFAIEKTGRIMSDNDVIGRDKDNFMGEIQMMGGKEFTRPIFIQYEHQKSIYLTNEDKEGLSRLSHPSSQSGSDKVLNFQSNFTTL